MVLNKIKPTGSKMIALPLETKNFVTETGIEVIQNQLNAAEVIEVSDDYESVFKAGDKIVYEKGNVYGQYYKGKQCIWLDCRAPNQGGDVWGIIE